MTFKKRLMKVKRELEMTGLIFCLPAEKYNRVAKFSALIVTLLNV